MVKHLSIILSKHIYNVVVQRVIGISLSFKLMFTFYNYDISLTWIKLKYSFAVYISIISDIFPLDPISFISLEAVAQYSSIKSNQYTGRNRLRVKTTFNFNSPSCKGYYCFLVKIKWYNSSLLVVTVVLTVVQWLQAVRQIISKYISIPQINRIFLRR